MTRKKIPAAWYGPNRDGLLDPNRKTSEERLRREPAWADAAYARRQSPARAIRALQAATDRAFGRHS